MALALLTSNGGYAQAFDVSVGMSVRIGDSEDLGLDYLFGLPVSACAGPDGSIFVADRVSMNVRQFSHDGEFIRTVGSRGQGPGEFMGILDIYSNDDRSRLFVVDTRNGRLTTFETSTGEVVDTYSMVAFKGNPKIDVMADGRHAVVSSSGRSVSGALGLPEISIIDPTKKDDMPPSTWVIPESLWAADDVVRKQLVFDPGSILATTSNTILYAPKLYEGRIFEILPEESAVVRVVKGILKDRSPYVDSEPPDEHAGRFPDVADNVPGSSEMVYWKFPCQSLKLFEVGELLGHIVYCEINGKRRHAIEFYTQSGEPLGMATLTEWAVENDHNTGMRIGDVDRSLSIYGVSLGAVPVAFVAQLEVEGKLLEYVEQVD